MGSEHRTVAASRRGAAAKKEDRPGDALSRFRREVLALAGLTEGMASGSPHSRAAAEALVELATDHDEPHLASILRPDPLERDGTWTVACYRIGDFMPVEVRDFATAVSALVNVASCARAEHVAAELVASTRTGVRWTALYRTGERLVFQLPSAANGSDSTRQGGGGLDAALTHWQERLGRWRTGTDADVIDLDPVDLDPTGTETTDLDPTHAGDGPPASGVVDPLDVDGRTDAGPSTDDHETLGKVLRHLVDIEARIAANARVTAELVARLDAVERALADDRQPDARGGATGDVAPS